MPSQVFLESIDKDVPQIAFMMSGKCVGRVNQFVW